MRDSLPCEAPVTVQAEILEANTTELFEVAVTRAAELLTAGELVALPTETVYGLAANALNPRAVERIYEIKERPANNPIIVHVASLEMARSCVLHWPEQADKLGRAFWPGPLTMVLPKSAIIPEIVTAGGGTVGIRWPSHPLMQAVIRRCGFPLAAPSANLSTQLSPTNAEHVRQQLGDRVPLIVDGGQSQVGIESSVLDLTTSPARLLRPGMIHEEAVAAVTGEATVVEAGLAGQTLKSPGLLAKHYAPKAHLRVLHWVNETDLSRQLDQLELNPAAVHVLAHTRIPLDPALSHVSVIPHDAEAFARALYAELHRCDEQGAEVIIVEQVPSKPEWRAIADRLKRASA